MAIAVQLNPDKVNGNVRMPTIRPVGEFELDTAYEFDDETGKFLLGLPDGPFMRATLKDARAQAAEDPTLAPPPTPETPPQEPPAPEATPVTEGA